MEGKRGMTYTLREVDVDAVVVNQHSLHLEVGLFAILLVVELDERILQAVTRALVANDLTG